MHVPHRLACMPSQRYMHAAAALPATWMLVLLLWLMVVVVGGGGGGAFFVVALPTRVPARARARVCVCVCVQRGRPPVAAELVELNKQVELPIGIGYRTLSDLCRLANSGSEGPGARFVGRVKRIGRRRHYGRVLMTSSARCPFRVCLVIGDHSMDLDVVVWGTSSWFER